MINEFTSKGITLTITDKNKNPYKYNDDYVIYKKVETQGKISYKKPVIDY